MRRQGEARYDRAMITPLCTFYVMTLVLAVARPKRGGGALKKGGPSARPGQQQCCRTRMH